MDRNDCAKPSNVLTDLQDKRLAQTVSFPTAIDHVVEYPDFRDRQDHSHNVNPEKEIRQMFGMAGETEFDLRFQLFGIPVRVHPIFWLTSAFIVWNGDRPDLVFVGVLCVFLSILVHELGHAVMSRRYGFPSEIVLYMFGGYATGSRFSTWKNVIVTAAGPGAGFALFGVVYGISSLLQNYAPGTLDSDGLRFAIGVLLFANLWWSILNLIPTLPLDGGQIMQALMHRYAPRGADRRVLQISIAASGGIALLTLMYMPGAKMMIILFGLLCAQNVMAYNQLRSYR